MNDDKTGQFQQTHGIHAFEDRGENALTPERGAYLRELKSRLATSGGRVEARQDLAAALGTIVNMGFSQMQQDAEAKKDIWNSGVVGRLGVYINAYIRLLDNWPDGEKPQNIIDALKGRTDNE